MKSSFNTNFWESIYWNDNFLIFCGKAVLFGEEFASKRFSVILWHYSVEKYYKLSGRDPLKGDERSKCLLNRSFLKIMKFSPQNVTFLRIISWNIIQILLFYHKIQFGELFYRCSRKFGLLKLIKTNRSNDFQQRAIDLL